MKGSSSSSPPEIWTPPAGVTSMVVVTGTPLTEPVDPHGGTVVAGATPATGGRDCGSGTAGATGAAAEPPEPSGLVALVRMVQVMPSGDVITRLPTPVAATATNSPPPYAIRWPWLRSQSPRRGSCRQRASSCRAVPPWSSLRQQAVHPSARFSPHSLSPKICCSVLQATYR